MQRLCDTDQFHIVLLIIASMHLFIPWSMFSPNDATQWSIPALSVWGGIVSIASIGRAVKLSSSTGPRGVATAPKEKLMNLNSESLWWCAQTFASGRTCPCPVHFLLHNIPVRCISTNWVFRCLFVCGFLQYLTNALFWKMGTAFRKTYWWTGYDYPLTYVQGY